MSTIDREGEVMTLQQWCDGSGTEATFVTNASTHYCFTCDAKVRVCRVESDTISIRIMYWCNDCEAFVAIGDTK